MIEIINSQRHNYEQYKNMNIELLESVIEIAQNNNINIMFIDFPVSRPYRKTIQENYPDYDTILQKLMKKYNIKTIDLKEADSWPDEFYRDTHHMTATGQERFTEILSLELIKLSNNDITHNSSGL